MRVDRAILIVPQISLIVCLRNERDLLARLLDHVDGCYDDLVVVHDGREEDNDSSPPPVDRPLQSMGLDYGVLDSSAPVPSFYTTPPQPALSGTIHELVLQHGGRYFEGPRCYQQEPHWPFAWSQSRNDWILRLDADEFPGDELRKWLREFRTGAEPATEISGYTCIWPLWNGRRATTRGWPTGRHFLFHRQRVRFFGMVEQVPIPDTRWEPLNLVLHHQPKSKSYGVRNILVRPQAYRWRRVITQSLMETPTSLPCWRWQSPQWPSPWNEIRSRPLTHSFKALISFPLHQLKGMLRAREIPRVSACLNPGLHHFMLGLRIFAAKFRKKS